MGGIKLQDLQYIKPNTLEDALEIMGKNGKDARILAGGTDIIIALKDKMISCKFLVDIKGIKELQELSYSDSEGLIIGAAVCLNEVINFEPVYNKYQILADAAKTLANSLLRNRATLVGNICNSSPGGDMLPAALVLEGVAHIRSMDGTRVVPLKEFFLGVKKNVLAANEIITKIVFPRTSGYGKYLKKSRIKGHDLAQISVAGFINENGSLKFALGAVGPTPMLVEGFKEYTKEEIKNNKQEIIDKIMKEISPIDDVRATKSYRLAMAAYLTNKILEELGGESL
jgi:CO/xanthine dehydrogenase FAD-binding subunit